MIRYLVSRVLQLLLVLLGVSVVVFVAMHLLPGDVATLLLGDKATAAQLARLRAQLGLDQPVPVQYWRFLIAALQGDFGVSITTGRPALVDVVGAFPVTLQLTLASLGLACLIGIPLGVLAGTRQGSGIDAAVLAGTLFGVSMPIFWLGLMLLILFAAGLEILPTGGLMPIGQDPPHITGMSVVDSVLAGDPRLVRLALLHLLLPAVTLATIPLALITRVTRAEVVAAGLLDHVRTARAKGLDPGLVVRRHVLRNAAIPILTVVGLQLGLLLSGAVLTESIFALPGLGRLMVGSILSRDYPVAQAAAMFVAGVFVLVNFLVDVGYLLLDPRVRRP
ncbi:MAG TPA: ABC transporter permease [Acetobacteraceae bacterium]|nr:ABC transporter permease [Acetobacteraceae bacterium]